MYCIEWCVKKRNILTCQRKHPFSFYWSLFYVTFNMQIYINDSIRWPISDQSVWYSCYEYSVFCQTYNRTSKTIFPSTILLIFQNMTFAGYLSPAFSCSRACLLWQGKLIYTVSSSFFTCLKTFQMLYRPLLRNTIITAHFFRLYICVFLRV